MPAADASVALKAEWIPAVSRAALADLTSMKTGGAWQVFGRSLRVTNLEKELFPARGRGKAITKRDLLRRTWVKALSEWVGHVVPELVSWTWEKSGRSGKARLDYAQNAINRTLVAPYSCRPAPGAPVSMPIMWDEFDDPTLKPEASGWRRWFSGTRFGGAHLA